MQVQQPTETVAGGAPARPFGRLVLLILLALLPMGLALACPEPAPFVAPETAEHDPSVRAHGPFEIPLCHHEGPLAKGPALLGDPREAASVEPADNGVAIPRLGPAHARLPDPGAKRHGSPATSALPAVPVYLLTQRLRV